MVMPTSWFDSGGVHGMKSKMQCAGGDVTAFCMWFTNETLNTGATIFDPALRTYSRKNSNQTIENPWRAPGTAPISSPCGVSGGNPEGCPKGDPTKRDCPGGGFSFGVDALAYNFTDVITTEWKIGSVVEAAWGIKANHGGGYAYRLCKVPEDGYTGLTEECFNKGHLDFVGETQWVQYGEDKSNRTAFKATRTNNGTFPKGSMWTMNPIPACWPSGGGFMNSKTCKFGTMFPPPAPGLEGFGERKANNWETDFGFNIVDQLQIPGDIVSGDYVLSFRWDCEQTPQVWLTCSTIKIVE